MDYPLRQIIEDISKERLCLVNPRPESVEKGKYEGTALGKLVNDYVFRRTVLEQPIAKDDYEFEDLTYLYGKKGHTEIAYAGSVDGNPKDKDEYAILRSNGREIYAGVVPFEVPRLIGLTIKDSRLEDAFNFSGIQDLRAERTLERGFREQEFPALKTFLKTLIS